MLYFLDNFLNFTPILWLFYALRCPVRSKFDCDGWAAILILSSAHVVLLKVSLFSGDHSIILSRHMATLKKSQAWSTVIGVAPQK